MNSTAFTNNYLAKIEKKRKDITKKDDHPRDDGRTWPAVSTTTGKTGKNMIQVRQCKCINVIQKENGHSGRDII